MSHYSGNMDDFGMDTRSLAGPLEAKLQAIQAAGFSQVMLSASDLVAHPQGLDGAVAAVRASGVRVTGFQALRDFEGLTGPLHDYKLDLAKSMLEMCHALDCRLLRVCASTLKESSANTQALLRDLRKLAMLAIPMNIKIAFEAAPQGQTVREFLPAWDLVCEADMPNLGLGLDASQMLDSATLLDDLDMLDPNKVFLVQLADTLGSSGAWRVFPGDGLNSTALAALVTRLHRLGYRGDYSFEVLNDDYLQMPAASVAQRARRAALWLGENVLQRSVPLPNQIRLKRSVAH
jgi:sugar phosphate isomerase/epimerase